MQAKLGSGTRFKRLKESLEKKGYSADSAKKISASIGIKKFGKSKMEKLAHKHK